MTTKATRVVADLGCVRINDGERISDNALMHDGRQWFVAHLVARRSWWRGQLLVVANASFMGGLEYSSAGSSRRRSSRCARRMQPSTSGALGCPTTPPLGYTCAAS